MVMTAVTTEPTNNPHNHTTHSSPEEVERRRDVYKALRTVILWTISDAFALCELESMWTQVQIDNLLSPQQRAKPKNIPLAVQRELSAKLYSTLLSEMVGVNEHKARKENGQSLQASVQDWSRVLADMVTQTYELRPLIDASIVGEFTGILTELGVGDPQNPRASLYLPNAVRERLNSKSQNVQ